MIEKLPAEHLEDVLHLSGDFGGWINKMILQS